MNGQWWITDAGFWSPAVWQINGKEMIFWKDGKASTPFFARCVLGDYRPVTASEAEAHLAKRFTGVRLPTVEC